MRKARSPAPRTPKKPADAEAGAALVRKFAIKLFDRDEGEAANWKLIAETLFKAAFEALDRSPDDEGRRALLRRVNGESYDRLAAIPKLILLPIRGFGASQKKRLPISIEP